MIEIATRSVKETKKVARMLAGELRARRARAAAVVALEGELGAGKTAFAQGFAEALGVKGKIQSPTFVLMKIYSLGQKPKSKSRGPRRLVHIDCYRIDAPKDLLRVGLKELLSDPGAIILIEWADRVKKLLPPSTLWLKFTHGGAIHERIIRVDDSL